VIAQLAVGANTNEIPCLRKLLGTLGNIAGAVITANALHTNAKPPNPSSALVLTTSSPSATTSPSCGDS
jgi:hypothetical protein